MLVYSYVAGEGVGLTEHQVSVLMQRKIKEVELRSRRAQLVMTEIIIELGYTHAPSRLEDEDVKTSFYTKGEK